MIFTLWMVGSLWEPNKRTSFLIHYSHISPPLSLAEFSHRSKLHFAGIYESSRVWVALHLISYMIVSCVHPIDSLSSLTFLSLRLDKVWPGCASAGRGKPFRGFIVAALTSHVAIEVFWTPHKTISDEIDWLSPFGICSLSRENDVYWNWIMSATRWYHAEVCDHLPPRSSQLTWNRTYDTPLFTREGAWRHSTLKMQTSFCKSKFSSANRRLTCRQCLMIWGVPVCQGWAQAMRWMLMSKLSSFRSLL